MPATKDYQSGSTIYIPGGGSGMHQRAKRNVVNGWSQAAVRRHTQWLWSVNTDRLEGFGYAVTLTMKECPEDSARFHSLRTSYLKRIQRMGATRVHWVIEWQRRGVPHMHLAVYFDHELSALEEFELKRHWLDVAEPYGVTLSAQYVLPITGPAGWLQYLSKHAARGAKHYQRNGKPAGWEKTGRLWGHTGDWPTEEPLTFDIPDQAYYRYRRLARSWRIANARAEKDPKTRAARIRSARRMLTCHDPKLSAVRGVSEWMSQPVTLAFMALLDRDGHRVIQTG